MKATTLLPLTLAAALLLDLTSCASFQRHEASMADIHAATKRIIAERENWGTRAHWGVGQDLDGKWRVEAHALDLSTIHKGAGCCGYAPGTGREILFSRSGKLISYVSTP